MNSRALLCAVFLAGSPLTASSADSRPGDAMLESHFRERTRALAGQDLKGITTLDDWKKRRPELHRQLQEMLGLYPWPEKTDLHATVTGHVDHPEFRVENLHFQSMPGLYVTGNLYIPKKLDGRAPAVLYVCGHARVAQDGVSFGNKVAYHHHGAWFARNGYVCLTIDTIQLGEIPGLHHGTYREGMWWWNARGYSPAGVEAWNSIRAVDYLQSRPEVDPRRIGVTGRSGGGAYSWWVAALDERIAAAAPVAGITDLENHVVDGVVEGHCDCMYFVNTFGWDYPTVAALVAPRPLLIANSDKDSIFPLDGVVRLHAKVRDIYKLHNALDRLGLLITEGPHKDSQDLQLPVFRWFNRHLKGEDPVIAMAAEKFFQPEQLRVFEELPSDERTSRIHESFVPAKHPGIPASLSELASMRNRLLETLRARVFGAWPKHEVPLNISTLESIDLDLPPGLEAQSCTFTSQESIRLPLILISPDSGHINSIELRALDASDWPEDQPAPKVRADIDSLQRNRTALALFAPRGIGPTAWSGDARKQVQIRRRFMLLGETLDSARVWDARRAIQAVRSLEAWRTVPLRLRGRGDMAVNLLYAALFEPAIRRIELYSPPDSHRHGPDYLNVLRFLDIPHTVAIAASESEVAIFGSAESGAGAWQYPQAVARQLRWPPERIQLKTEAAGH